MGEGKYDLKKQIILGILLAVVAASVLFFTFQGPHETVSLSEHVREWAIKIGYKGDMLQFRSDIHLVEYFIVGIVSSLFCLAMGWRIWAAAIIGCSFGLIDEIIKIFLPTREFDLIDLGKDFIGVWIATIIVLLLSNLVQDKYKTRKKGSKEKIE